VDTQLHDQYDGAGVEQHTEAQMGCILELIEVVMLDNTFELGEGCLEAHVSEVDPPPAKPLKQQHR